MIPSENINHRLVDALVECRRLREENRQLRERLGLPQIESPTPPIPSQLTPALSPAVTGKSSPDEKVELFRSVFRGREDVYALRWEGRNGKTGYSPACRKMWGNPLSKHPDKPKEYFPLTDQVIHDHLTGKITAGVYPLLADETCWFLAADFDKAARQDDVRAFLQTCAEWKAPTILERSRSGRGGHIWFSLKRQYPQA